MPQPGTPKKLKLNRSMKTYEDSLMAQRLKRLPGMQETWVRSLGWEDPQRRKWKSTPVLLPGKSHGGREEPGRLQCMGLQRVGHDWATSLILTYEDLQDLLELKPQKDVLFIIGNWNAKLGSQETHGVTGKFGLGVQNEAGQRLVEFCQGIYMEFRKMVTITLCTRQQKRHWCIEQSYGLCGRGRGWEDLGEWHWNM